MQKEIIVKMPFMFDCYNKYIPRTIILDTNNLHSFIDEVTNLYKFFEQKFTDSEISYIKEYYNTLTKELQNDICEKTDYKNCKDDDYFYDEEDDEDERNKSYFKRVNEVVNYLKPKINNFHEKPRKYINDCSCPTFEKIEKVNDNEYVILWGS